MNLRNWSKGHTIGLLIGILTPLVIFPLVLLVMAWTQDYMFEQLWSKFKFNGPYRIKIFTISNIANLITFYTFLNREKYPWAMGIILGTIAWAPYILYTKFF